MMSRREDMSSFVDEASGAWEMVVKAAAEAKRETRIERRMLLQLFENL